MISPAALLLIAYFLLLGWWGAVSASLWAASSVRKLPEGLFLLFGLAVPAAGALLAPFLPLASLVLPLCLGGLWLRGRGERLYAEAVEEALRLDERAWADALLEADPKNAAAWLLKAKALEEKGALESALALYRRAAALCDRTVPGPELAEIEERVALLMERRREPAQPKGRLAALAGALPPLETPLLALGVLLALESLALGLDACAAMLFLRWLRAAPDAR